MGHRIRLPVHNNGFLEKIPSYSVHDTFWSGRWTGEISDRFSSKGCNGLVLYILDSSNYHCCSSGERPKTGYVCSDGCQKRKLVSQLERLLAEAA